MDDEVHSAPRKPETFTFLGFTHYCRKNSRGYFVIWRKTANKRRQAKLKEIQHELRARMHWAVPRGLGCSGSFKAITDIMLFRATQRHWAPFGTNCAECGGRFYAAAVTCAGSTGISSIVRLIAGCRTHASSDPYPSVRFDATHPR